MGLISFGVLFPKIADDECRSILVRGHPRVPDDDYAFLESYCVDAQCDCRRVMLNVFSRRADRIVATISYGFDREEEDAGPYLDPLNPQGKDAKRLLRLAQETVLPDAEYIARLERHYHLVKAALNDPEHPVHTRIPPRPSEAEEAWEAIKAVATMQAKVGRNELCPCGSGRKFKRCCLRAPQGRPWKRGSLSRA